MCLRNDMQILSDNFARTRAHEDAYPNAYFAYNFPMNYMKIRYILDMVHCLYPQLFDKPTTKILDIGCGEGAGLFGAYHSLKRTEDVMLHGIDVARSMISKCRYLARSLFNNVPKPRIRIEKRDIADGLLKTRTQYDMILLSNSLIEITMDVKKSHRFLLRLSKNLHTNGIIIVIEPALVTAARRLMDVRDYTIDKQKLAILLPCLHQSTCPLSHVRENKEWCHQSVHWDPPEYLQIINQGLNREIKTLKFSYIVISRCRHDSINGYLVISPLFKEKGRKRCFLCTEEGRIELIRLNKRRSPQNSNFDRICKGAVIALDGISVRRPDDWRIHNDSCVHLLYRYNLSQQD